MSSESRVVLQRWLAARYRRSAFSDEFNERLKRTKIEDGLIKALKKNKQYIGGVFFDIDDGEEVEHGGDDDPFKIAIFLLYSTSLDPTAALAEAEALKDDVDALFVKTCRAHADGKWRSFELVECIAISDEAMSYALADRLQRWQVEHLSLRELPVGVIIDD